MRLVVDANVIISGLIADGTTRELLVTVDADLLTPEVVHDEIAAHEASLIERSGLSADRFRQFLRLVFEGIESVPVREFHECIEPAERAIADVDPDDVLYLACALGREATVWTDDSDFHEQDLVPVVTTAEVVHSVDPG